MVNRLGFYLAIGIALSHVCVANADEGRAPSTGSLSGLDLFDDTYGPSDSRCGLGFIGYGSPVVVTRVSAWSPVDWLAEADQLVELNGKAIRRKSDLSAALDAVSIDDQISMVVLRDDRQIEVSARCQESTAVLEAREEALIGVSEGQWQTCMSATILEEIRWGGPNSQSAGLRLWCHQAQLHRSSATPNESSPLSRIHAQLIYDYANLLLDELKYVPNGLEDFRSQLEDRVKMLDESGVVRRQPTFTEPVSTASR